MLIPEGITGLLVSLSEASQLGHFMCFSSFWAWSWLLTVLQFTSLGISHYLLRFSFTLLILLQIVPSLNPP